MEAVKLVVVFVIIVIALRRKISVGLTLFAAGVITALLHGLNLIQLLESYWSLIKSQRFISLTAIVMLITLLGSLLKELKFLDKLTSACYLLPGGSRTAATILPGFVGLMPMPGGSLLSAPLVDNVLSQQKKSPEFKLLTNYWFRHITEFSWPIYPGLVLTEGLTGMPVYKVALLQAPLTVVMFVIGLVFLSRKMEVSNRGQTNVFRALAGVLSTIWPIALAITLYGLLKIDLALAVLISLIVLVMVARPERQMLTNAFKSGVSFQLAFLVFGILSFQTVLELTGAIESIPTLAISLNLPAEIVIFAVCFAAGILTGMVAAFVGLGYSLLAGYLYQPEIVPSHILLAYLSGFLGIILSPTHLCLVLTNEYFGSNLLTVYRKMIIPLLIMLALGLMLYFSPWPGFF